MTQTQRESLDSKWNIIKQEARDRWARFTDDRFAGLKKKLHLVGKLIALTPRGKQIKHGTQEMLVRIKDTTGWDPNDPKRRLDELHHVAPKSDDKLERLRNEAHNLRRELGTDGAARSAEASKLRSERIENLGTEA